MTDYYLNNTDHPLHGKFHSEKHWETDIFAINFNLPEKTRYSLIKTIAKNVQINYNKYQNTNLNTYLIFI